MRIKVHTNTIVLSRYDACIAAKRQQISDVEHTEYKCFIFTMMKLIYDACAHKFPAIMN